MAKRKLDSEEPGLSQQDAEKVRKLSASGVCSSEVIASVLELRKDLVEQVLEPLEPQAQASCQSHPVDGEEVVKRLLKDPEELCCPLSHQLMEDPVVAADGSTYERSWIEDCFQRNPNKSPVTRQAIETTVLNPNQAVKSMIITFKENSVKEILSVVPQLLPEEALKVLERGEEFIRPLLPDASAKRKLAELLLLRLSLPGDQSAATQEGLTLLVEVEDHGKLQQLLDKLGEEKGLALLPSLDEKAISCLAHLPGQGLLNQELARTCAKNLAMKKRSTQTWRSLWQLLEEKLEYNWDSWTSAASCLLSAHRSSLNLDLTTVKSEVLAGVRPLLDDRQVALDMANAFFENDIGIATIRSWPPQASAGMLQELAQRQPDEEKLQLLQQAHKINKTNVSIRLALSAQLHHQLMTSEAPGLDTEGMYLKLALVEGQELPVDVLPKLTLEERHLAQASPSQLMLLSEQLGKQDRPLDGARVAVVAARGFGGSGMEAEGAFLQAFSLDLSNRDAARGVVAAVKSMRERCQQLEDSNKVLQDSRKAQEKDGKQLKELKEECLQLAKRCSELEEKSQMSSSPQMGSLSVVWDLSSYDFTGFQKGQEQKSEKFQLPGGIKAWMELYPKGHANSSEGKAGLFLYADKPTMVKWSFQSGSSEARTWEWDFSKDLTADGTPDGWGNKDFMPTSEANGRITLGILSVRAPNSTLSFI